MARLIQISTVLMLILLSACGRSTSLSKLQKELDQYPQYSVILQDMREEGNFFKDYYHQYRIVYPEISSNDTTFKEYITDYLEVDKKDFQKYYNYLGMTILSKGNDGKVNTSAQPPGYQYVGDPRYGRWRTGSDGSSFWEFYGKFAFFNAMFNMFSRPVYRGDWDNYRRYRSRGDDYFGRNKQYGTNGSYTKQTHPNFFQRRQAREMARKKSFSDRVKSRSNRSNMSSTRRRSGGFGK